MTPNYRQLARLCPHGHTYATCEVAECISERMRIEDMSENKDLAALLADVAVQAIATKCPVSTGDRAREVAEAAIRQVIGAQETNPVARVAGQYGGRTTVEPLVPYLLPVGMALYPHPSLPQSGDGGGVADEPSAEFRKWWLTNVPAGTVIGSPEWWLPRIWSRAAHPAPSRIERVAVPEGWRLVPVESTMEMEEACEDVLRDEDVDPVFAGEIDKGAIWAAMLAAAPDLTGEKE